MKKYLCSREIDRVRIPVDRKDRGEGLCMQMKMFKKDIEKGIIKNWGDLFANTMHTESFRRLR